jgi:hypothetical protein
MPKACQKALVKRVRMGTRRDGTAMAMTTTTTTTTKMTTNDRMVVLLLRRLHESDGPIE